MFFLKTPCSVEFEGLGTLGVLVHWCWRFWMPGLLGTLKPRPLKDLVAICLLHLESSVFSEDWEGMRERVYLQVHG